MRKLFVVLLICVTIVRILLTLHNPLEGRRIRLTGTLSQDPKEYETSFLIHVSDYRFFVPQNDDIAYGSKLVVEGTVKAQELNTIRVVSVKKPHSVLSLVRSTILNNMRSTLSEPYSSLVAGATLGAPNIPKNFSEALQRTGTSHIVVASGGNLAILAGFLESLLGRVMKRRLFLPISALVLLLYSALTGFGAPVVRALIMWLVLMAVQYTGRVVKPFSVLLCTIILMILYKPLWLYELSFQLSVGATAGILAFGHRFRKLFRKIPIVSEALAMSLSAQLGIFPISILAFHEVNLLSPLWNVLVLWTVPYITIIGMFGSVMTMISEALGRLIFLSTLPFTWYFTTIIS